MLLIDDRENPSLRRALAGYDLEVETCRLEFGDACFEGCGPNAPIMIGIERKRLPDLVQSMTDRRLTGLQLIGMSELYDALYLVVEDAWRPAANGGIEVHYGKEWRPLWGAMGGVSFRQVDSFLQSLSSLMGVTVIRSCWVTETAAIYASRYHWWRKKWSDHHTGEGIFLGKPATRHMADFDFRQPGLVERAAALLPGIDRRAWEVGKRFHSVREMVDATEKDWRQIPGVGPGIARSAWAALNRPAAADGEAPAVERVEAEIARGASGADLIDWSDPKKKSLVDSIERTREQFMSRGWEWNEDEHQFERDGWRVFIRPQGKLAPPVVQWGRMNNLVDK